MEIGDPIPLQTQLADYDDAQFPLATVKDADGVEITDSPFALEADDDSGFYVNRDAVMPNTPWVSVDIKVYADSGHTELSSNEGGTDYNVFLSSTGSSSTLPTAFDVVGVIEEDGCSPFPLQATIIQGSDRTLAIRLIQNATFDPFDLTGATLVECRFRNADGSVLSLKTSDVGDPVEIISAEAGKLICVLTDTQTALLAVLSPSPFTILVTKAAGVTIANFSTQLGVTEKDA